MTSQTHAVGALWLVAGALLCIWAVYGVVVDGPWSTVDEFGRNFALDWLAVFLLGAAAIVASLAFMRGSRMGRSLIKAISWISLGYAAVYALTGGFEHAVKYAVWVCGLSALAIYGLIAIRNQDAA